MKTTLSKFPQLVVVVVVVVAISEWKWRLVEEVLPAKFCEDCFPLTSPSSGRTRCRCCSRLASSPSRSYSK